MIIFLGNGHSLNLYKDVIDSTKDTHPDIVVSCQYPFLVPSSLIDSHVCVNIHYGELPTYAGCNPIFWQMMEDTQSGVTLHYMDKNFDSGDIIDTYIFPNSRMTADEVYEECARAGLEMFKKHFGSILKGTAPRRKQDLSLRRYKNKTEVNFDRLKYINDFEDKKVRSVHFKGKQHPICKIGGREFELHAI